MQFINHLMGKDDKTQFFKEQKDVHQMSIQKGKFPLIWGPMGDKGFINLQETVEKNRKAILTRVSDIGAIVFRGFDVQSPNESMSVLHKLGLAQFQQTGGAAAKHIIIGSSNRPKSLQAFTLNQAPSTQPIPIRNELAQNEACPQYVAFYCQAEVEKGGSALMINCNEMYKYVQKKHPNFLKELESRGVRYIRVLEQHDNLQTPVDRGWKNTFGVQTRQQAQAIMKQRGYDFEWLGAMTNECKLSSKKLSAIKVGRSGEKIFCNQLIAVFKGWIDHKHNPQMCLKYGDSTDMPMNVLEDICLHAPKEVATIPLEKGDLVLIDNQVVAYSRQPFTGTKKIYATFLKGEAPLRVGPQLTLNSGDLMPVSGFGTWKIKRDQCAQVVYNAIKIGYRLLDCACDYGNEEQVGAGIARAIKEKLITREELFVTSKLWNTYHRKQHVKQACLKTLKDLKLDYLDLYHMHFPISLKFVPFEQRYPPEWVYNTKQKHPKMIEDPVPLLETWQAMEELVNEGLVRNIGVCNFGTALLRDLINSHTAVKPAVLQVEIHPYLNQKRLIKYGRQNGVPVTSYSTLGGTSYVQSGGANKDDEVLNDPLIKSLAVQYKKTAGQIILRWAVQQGLSVIPKSSKKERVAQNHAITDWSISQQDMAQIDALNKNRRFNDPGKYCEQSFGMYFPIFD